MSFDSVPANTPTAKDVVYSVSLSKALWGGTTILSSYPYIFDFGFADSSYTKVVYFCTQARTGLTIPWIVVGEA